MRVEKLGIPRELGDIDYGTVLVTKLGDITLIYEVQSAMLREFPIINVCRGSLCKIIYTDSTHMTVDDIRKVPDEKPYYNLRGGIFGTYSRNLSRFPTHQEEFLYDKIKHI